MKNTIEDSSLFREFIVSHRAYYARVLPSDRIEVNLSLSSREGGTAGEFAIRWHQLGGRPVPRLEAFGDSWNALVNHFGDVLAWLASQDGEDPQVDDVVSALKGMGIEDGTKYIGPKGETGDGDPVGQLMELVEQTGAERTAAGRFVARLRDLADKGRARRDSRF